MFYNRILTEVVDGKVGKQKVILIFGTRRTGKSFLVKEIFKKHQEDALILQGEDISVQEILKNRTISNYQNFLKGKKLLIIDEAQVIPEIGKILKLMIDNIEPLTIIATGSSSFDLQNSSGEPLVGRNLTYQLFPFSQEEISQKENLLDTQNNLEERLVYGSYPEIFHLETLEEKQVYLQTIVENYLLKDILAFENVKGSKILVQLLQLLAWQVGNLVSTVELGNTLQINKATVERYLDLLSKVYIIYPLSGFQKNLRKEITKSKKWYFYDNGIRNALINNFSPLVFRNDQGLLWEQYILSERRKYQSYHLQRREYYFWRTYDGQEIDQVEIDNYQKIILLECKWKDKKVKIPTAFQKAYENFDFFAINSQNYLEFIT